MMTPRYATPAALVLALILCATPALALIKVEIPVSKIYGDAKAVVIGTVSRVNPDNCVVDVKVAETMKGESPGESVRVQVAAPAGLIKQIAANEPVVLFLGERDGKPLAVVHVADTWLLADGLPGANPPAFRVVQTFDGGRSFPGRTAALARIVAELKAGKQTLVDVTDPLAFRGAARELADLKVRPTFLAAADLNGDGALDLVVGTAQGVRLFLGRDKGWTDATEAGGLAGVAASHCAFADVNGDGKPDLLLGPALWLNTGGRFTRSNAALDLPPGADWLAATLADATGDGRPDAVVLTKTGSLVTCRNPGSPDKPWPAATKALWPPTEPPALAAAFSNDWGDNGELHALAVRATGIIRYAAGPSGGAAADFTRLTGLAPASDGTPVGKQPVVLFAAAIDTNGDGRTDFVAVTEAGGWALINRGFGAFFHSKDIHPVFHAQGDKALPFRLTPACCVAAGRTHAPDSRRRNLLVLTGEGRLFEIENPAE